MHLLVLVGPTASGKTSAAIQVAKTLGCAIIGADARQFYHELNIGTAKPTVQEQDGVPHHLIGHLSIHQSYTVADYEHDALAVIDALAEAGNKHAVVVGGSGLYVNTLLFGMDEMPEVKPEVRERVRKLYELGGLDVLQAELQKLDPDFFAITDLHNHARLMRALEVCLTTGRPFSSFRQRVPVKRNFSHTIFGIDMPRESLYDRINQRVLLMLEAGLEHEARSMRAFQQLQALQTIGYREWWPYLDGASSLDQVINGIQQNTRRYAKRQMTWFRNQLHVQWSPSGTEVADAMIAHAQHVPRSHSDD